jgi:cysteine desulfurase/selenocysteine lyase
LDEEKICIRSGHHCAMPLHTRLALEASARVSFYFYNTFDDVDRLIAGLKKAAKIFR